MSVDPSLLALEVAEGLIDHTIFVQTSCVFDKNRHESTKQILDILTLHVMYSLVWCYRRAEISEQSTSNNPLSSKHSKVSVALESAFPGRQVWTFNTHPSSSFILPFESSMHSSVLWGHDTADLDAKVSCGVPHTAKLLSLEACGSRWLSLLWWFRHADVGGNKLCSGPLDIGGSEKLALQADQNLPPKAKCHPGPIWLTKMSYAFENPYVHEWILSLHYLM